MTSISTDTYNSSSASDAINFNTINRIPVHFIHPYTKHFNNSNNEIANYKRELKHLDEHYNGFINNIELLEQEYYSQIIETDAILDYLRTYTKIWPIIYNNEQYEKPVELHKIIMESIHNVNDTEKSLHEVKKNYYEYNKTYIINRQKIVQKILLHTEGVYSTEFV